MLKLWYFVTFLHLVWCCWKPSVENQLHWISSSSAPPCDKAAPSLSQPLVCHSPLLPPCTETWQQEKLIAAWSQEHNELSKLGIIFFNKLKTGDFFLKKLLFLSCCQADGGFCSFLMAQSEHGAALTQLSLAFPQPCRPKVSSATKPPSSLLFPAWNAWGQHTDKEGKTQFQCSANSVQEIISLELIINNKERSLTLASTLPSLLIHLPK